MAATPNASTGKLLLLAKAGNLGHTASSGRSDVTFSGRTRSYMQIYFRAKQFTY